MGKRRKIALWAALSCISLPVILVGWFLVWAYSSDRTNGSIVSSGMARRYALYVPKSYVASRSTPLVISLHPAAAWPLAEASISGWNTVAEEHGFIVVYPAGSGALFNESSRGPHAWPVRPPNVMREVRFVSDLIAKLEAEYNIDRNRIYVNGMSNGGGMAFAMSCELGDRIAALGEVASAQTLAWKRCDSSRPVPTIVFHGTEDRFAPYLGGSSLIAPNRFPNIPDWTARVAQRNGCSAHPSNRQITSEVQLRAYSGCRDDSDVVLYTVTGGGHTWPGDRWLPEVIVGHSTQDINATRLMWDFFMGHPLKSK